MAKNRAVFGIYSNRESVDEGIGELKNAGFRSADISVLLPENVGTKEFAHEKATKAPEGAAAGAASEAVIGGALGWLAGIGTLGIPGLGPFIAAGPIMALLAGVGAGGAVGGITGALVGLGIPEYEAKRYEGRLRSGGILLSVHCDDSQWARKARVILERTGAVDISSTSECKADYAVNDRPIPRRERVEGGPRTRLRVDPNGRYDEARPETVPLVKTSTPSRRGLARDFAEAPDHERHPLAHIRHLTVRQVMAKEFEVVDADTSLSEAAQKMRRLNVGFLPVRSGEAIAGVVTDRDITVRASAPGFSPTEAMVSSIMTTNYVYCFDHQDLVEAARIMEANQVRRLPVVDKDMRLVGVISLADLASKAGDEKLAGEVLKLVAGQKG